MRQRGSQRARLRTASHGNGNPNDMPAPPVLYAEADPNLNQSAVDVVPAKRRDKKNVSEVPISSDDDVAVCEYLHRVNERRTRSERYILTMLIYLHLRSITR